MTFESVLPLVKEGEKAFRTGWNGKGCYVVRQKGYPEETATELAVESFNDMLKAKFNK